GPSEARPTQITQLCAPRPATPRAAGTYARSAVREGSFAAAASRAVTPIPDGVQGRCHGDHCWIGSA
ncbi:MAG TPA: hypothetical protein VH307_18665, partial [Streptosporangiaceae bacterium]|nr:hypothetical protein [Streptosporangiaceae bacterium]